MSISIIHPYSVASLPMYIYEHDTSGEGKLDWLEKLRAEHPRVVQYNAALAIVIVAVVLRLWLDPVLGRTGFAIFLTGMLLAAWVGGLGPCLISQTLILLAEALWFAPPGKPAPMTLQGIVSLLAFYSVGGIVAILSESRKAAYQRLIQQKKEALIQREQLRATFACIGDGIIVTDSAGLIAQLNPVAEQMIGWPLSACEGKPVGEIFIAYDENSSQTIASPIGRVLKHGEVLHETSDWLLNTREGKVVPISFSAAPVFAEAKATTGVVLVVTDQTERRQILRELRDANQRKDDFLATLAHELRNPLAPIATGIELLKMCSDDRETLDEVIDTMARQTKHMVSLIDDLLDVSRITRGKLELRMSEIPLAQVVKEAVEATRPVIEEAKHDLQIKLPEQPIVLYADSVRLTQILSNLLNNAAKYTPHGGAIRMVAEIAKDQVLISVEDNGIGISREDQRDIFEMFMQARSNKERGHKGLGIGLALVKRLVEMHGGTIEVMSEGPNRGTRFCIALPNVVVESSAKLLDGTQSHAVSSATSGRVLVVDDNEDALITLSRLVKIQGHKICVAHDGLEAVRRAEEFRPHIVLMDIGMPGLNGYEAASRIRQQPWGKKIVLIAVTGWGQEEDRERSQSAGFDHHLVKPIKPGKLQEVMSYLLVSSQTDAPSTRCESATSLKNSNH